MLVWASKRAPEVAAASQPPPADLVARGTGAKAESAPALMSETPAPSPPNLQADAFEEKSSSRRPKLSAGVEDIEKLARAKVEDRVLQAFIENSPVAYYLSPEEIVYLLEIGVSSDAVAGLIRRGAKLRGQAAQEWKEKEERAQAAGPAPTPGAVLPAAGVPPIPAPTPASTTVTAAGYPGLYSASSSPATSTAIYFPGHGYRYCRPFWSHGYRGYWRPPVGFHGSYWHPRWSVGFCLGRARLHGGWHPGRWCW